MIATAGLTAADYARRGFFELVTVATLVFPVLLASHAVLPDDERAQRVFRWLAAALTLLTFLVMTSAAQRMALYFIGFGLTELRFYTSAFMCFLAALFLWYGATILRGRSEGFCFGGMVLGSALLAVLNFINPDAFIVRVNFARLAHHRSFDVEYASTLSADAVPELVDGLTRLPDPGKRAAALKLRSRWMTSRKEDWRVWNFDRAVARRECAAEKARLDAKAAEPTSPR